MNKFETVLLLSPDLSTQVVSKEEDIFSKNIENNNGKIVNIEDWGLRDLAFTINNYKKAFYKFYQIELEGTKINDIKKQLTQNEKVLRHLFVKVNTHQDLPTKMKEHEEK